MSVKREAEELVRHYCKCGAYIEFKRSYPVTHCPLCGRKVPQ